MSPESILAGWLVDGSGQPHRENVLLTINNGTITQIEEATPEKTRQQEVIDFSHCTLLPGLIDAHIHLFMSGTEDLDIREKQLTQTFDDVIGGIEERLGDLFACGIETTSDPPKAFVWAGGSQVPCMRQHVFVDGHIHPGLNQIMVLFNKRKIYKDKAFRCYPDIRQDA
jgi:hypothetical protein